MLALRLCHMFRRCCAQTTSRVCRCSPSDNVTCSADACALTTLRGAYRCLPSHNVTCLPMLIADNVTFSPMRVLRQRLMFTDADPQTMSCAPPMPNSDNAACSPLLALRRHHVLADALSHQAKPRSRRCCAQTTPRVCRCPPSDNVTRSPMRALAQTTSRVHRCSPSGNVTCSADGALRQRRVLALRQCHVLADARPR